jgi:hypothetical protein
MTRSQKALPLDVVEAAIQVAGRAFYYKSGLKRLFLRAGVTSTMFQRYEQEMKFIIARNIFSDLEERGDTGYQIALSIVREMCSIRQINDDKIDRRAALSSIEVLRNLTATTARETAQEEADRARRADAEQERIKRVSLRQQELTDLRRQYGELLKEPDRQKRGYELERLLERLFRANELEYRASFRSRAQQIDGAFKFEKFDYLVEIRWTQGETDLEELNGFKGKVDRKIQSTRGLFLSMAGFRDEVVAEFQQGIGTNIILMDGHDLAVILEGRMDLADALELKASKAAQEGLIYLPLRDHLLKPK